MVTTSRFAANGIWLFMDQMLIAIGGWAFWIVIFRLITPAEIGVATTIYNLVFLFSTIIQLGFEYPLLKKASDIGSPQVFGTILVMEMLILSFSVPFIIYAINSLFQNSVEQFAWITVGMLIVYTISFISRFALLAISDIKSILIIDLLGTSSKFILALFLVTVGFAELAILLAIFVQGLLIMTASLTIAIKKIGLQFGTLRHARGILKVGVANSMSKFSRMLIVSLGVVLLAFFAIDKSDIGIFYVASMISIVVSTLASSIAYTAIPESTRLKSDLSHISLRIGLTLISPLTVTLIVAPKFLLSLFGDQYVSAELMLLFLSIGILPSAVTINTISMFNNQNMNRKIILLGSVQIITLIISFFLLVPNYGTLGAAFSMLISFMASGILSTFWLDSGSVKYVVRSSTAIAIGVASGYVISIIFYPIHPLVTIFIAVTVNIICMLLLKNTSTLELRQLVQALTTR